MEILTKPKISTIKIVQSEEEKLQKKRLYRKEYTKRPHVQEKSKIRLQKPDVIEARKRYADREDVKERKKVLSAAARAMNKKLKEEYPDIHYKLLNETIEKIQHVDTDEIFKNSHVIENQDGSNIEETQD